MQCRAPQPHATGTYVRTHGNNERPIVDEKKAMPSEDDGKFIATEVEPESGCRRRDRFCSVAVGRQGAGVPLVWVGPKDGRWLRVLDDEELSPNGQRPCEAVSDEDQDVASAVIFAAIASYRDSLCATTLKGIFGRARFPERVRVGVIQQNNPDEDSDCLETYCSFLQQKECPFRSQIFIKRFSSDEAKGPTWARAQDADLVPENAEFCLRTDSHMAFAKDWDVKQIAQWHKARNEFAVLSTYVADASQITEDGAEVNVNGKWEVPHLCSILWQDGHVRNMQAKAARNLKRPKLTTLWAAGLSFSKCHAERVVPYDPHTPYIFWGEEFTRTARFFTHGYDVYTPDRTIIAHDAKKPKATPPTSSGTARAARASTRTRPSARSGTAPTAGSGLCSACRGATPTRASNPSTASATSAPSTSSPSSPASTSPTAPSSPTSAATSTGCPGTAVPEPTGFVSVVGKARRSRRRAFCGVGVSSLVIRNHLLLLLLLLGGSLPPSSRRRVLVVLGRRRRRRES